MDLKVNDSTPTAVEHSFDRIAHVLFNNYMLVVNNTTYRLIDIEFYYLNETQYKDVYAHRHPEQLTTGKWYFHGSGLDITFGDKVNHGGILIRAIAKISTHADPNKHFIENEIHGPIKVKTEVCSKFNGVFDTNANVFQLQSVDEETKELFPFQEFYKTRRIGLNSAKDPEDTFHSAKLRYVIFPASRLRDKTQIAKDIKSMGLKTDAEVNQLLGSRFL